jgi:hypothetical protein
VFPYCYSNYKLQTVDSRVSTQTCGTDEAEGDKVDILTAEARIVASCVAVITLRHNFACEIPVTSYINYKVLFPDQQLGKLV